MSRACCSRPFDTSHLGLSASVQRLVAEFRLEESVVRTNEVDTDTGDERRYNLEQTRETPGPVAVPSEGAQGYGCRKD
jgi:hypothetical protein